MSGCCDQLLICVVLAARWLCFKLLQLFLALNTPCSQSSSNDSDHTCIHTLLPPGCPSVPSQITMTWREKHHDCFSLSQTETYESTLSFPFVLCLCSHCSTRVHSTGVFWTLPLSYRLEVRKMPFLSLSLWSFHNVLNVYVHSLVYVSDTPTRDV